MGQGEERAGGEAQDQTCNPLVPILWAQANHDLRQPLQALFFMTRSLARTLEDAKQQETVKYMEAALRGLQTKLDLLTDLSRIDSGSKAPELRPCSLVEIFQSLLPALSAIAAAQGIRLRSSLSPAIVTSDATLLTLMIRSLILNAFKLANHSDVLVGRRRRADRVSLELYFKGPAVSEAHLRGAFVELTPQKSEPTSSELGLGLGFIAHLGRSLDHAIECSSLPHGGICIALSLPRAD
jgi:two-component system, sensor histidine kinase